MSSQPSSAIAANGGVSAGGSSSVVSNMAQTQQGLQSSQKDQNSSPHLDTVVIDYLNMKGYTRTEQVLRQESSNLDKEGKSIALNGQRAEDLDEGKYKVAFALLNTWIDQNLDIYKYELKRLLWPVFIYSYISLVQDGWPIEAKSFFKTFSGQFERHHADELHTLQTITIKEQVIDNELTKLYHANKYRIPLNTNVYFNLITFLETNGKLGGDVILLILQTNCKVLETTRGPLDMFSFEAIINRAKGIELGQTDDLEEGIPGAFEGVSNMDIANNSTALKLGQMPMETELAGDVRAELEEEDAKKPPEPGQQSLVEAFDQKIKREDSIEAPTRTEIPLPPSRARDVVMEVQKIREYRDRFKIESRTGGVGAAASVCMFTFHNTLDTVTCMEFSDDTKLVAVGTEESYIRVWDLGGDALPSAKATDLQPSSSRRLVGHSASVYSVSFSPSILGPEDAGADVASTRPRLLLSCSSDRTVRLWSLEAWACLVVYKGHEGPVWNVSWGPFGHYFATCGWDRTVRVWTQDHISYLRLLVGHDTSVNQVAWHPNGAYVFSASDEADKTIRMWSIATGNCVRILTGHSDFISALECSPSGKILASADGGGTIILWDLARGTQIKRCRGHGKGGIWSLSFSVESTVLTSGGADGTVRVWDINVPPDPYKGGDGGEIVVGSQADASRLTSTTGAANSVSVPSGAGGATTGGTTAGGSGSVGGGGGGGGGGGVGVGVGSGIGGGRRKGKDVVVTPDQISAFPTKKTPVYKVKFTRMNLIMAGGCYLP